MSHATSAPNDDGEGENGKHAVTGKGQLGWRRQEQDCDEGGDRKHQSPVRSDPTLLLAGLNETRC
jgi:hypothetical protein